MFCGKEFENQTKNQKFCSCDCYIRNLFWRQEGTEEIMKLILAGKKVLMVSVAQRHTQWRNKMSNSFAKVCRWSCNFHKEVQIAKWGKQNEFYILWQKAGIVLNDYFCYVVFRLRSHARRDYCTSVPQDTRQSYQCESGIWRL